LWLVAGTDSRKTGQPSTGWKPSIACRATTAMRAPGAQPSGDRIVRALICPDGSSRAIAKTVVATSTAVAGGRSPTGGGCGAWAGERRGDERGDGLLRWAVGWRHAAHRRHRGSGWRGFYRTGDTRPVDERTRGCGWYRMGLGRCEFASVDDKIPSISVSEGEMNPRRWHPCHARVLMLGSLSLDLHGFQASV
jgi:hypothetical protein